MCHKFKYLAGLYKIVFHCLKKDDPLFQAMFVMNKNVHNPDNRLADH